MDTAYICLDPKNAGAVGGGSFVYLIWTAVFSVIALVAGNLILNYFLQRKTNRELISNLEIKMGNTFSQLEIKMSSVISDFKLEVHQMVEGLKSKVDNRVPYPMFHDSVKRINEQREEHDSKIHSRVDKITDDVSKLGESIGRIKGLIDRSSDK